jgi:TldD protein
VLFSNIIYKETITKKYFINENSFIVQETPRIHVFIKITGKKDNIIETGIERYAVVGGLERISLKNIEKVILIAHKKLKEKIFAENCPAKKTDILITPEISDLLAHEAIGHASEGDIVASKASVLKKGLKITNNEDINIVDNPLLKKFGYFKYDDEGVKAREKQIVKKGIINDYLLDITSATKLSLISNGSARAESYRNMPIPRMSNTYFLEGKDKYNDILKEFNGLLIDGFRGGEVDPAVGTFMFGIDRAYLVDKGKIKKTYKQASISGNIITYLNKVSKISNKIGEFSHGYCGKDGQMAFVSGSGPYMKIDKVVVGGTKHE